MILHSLGIALCGVELGGEGLKIRVNDEGNPKPLVVVLKGDYMFSLLWHIHSDRGLPNFPTVKFMGFQQIFSRAAVQASLAEVLAPAVFVLAIE